MDKKIYASNGVITKTNGKVDFSPYNSNKPKTKKQYPDNSFLVSLLINRPNLVFNLNIFMLFVCSLVIFIGA